ncbi:MAG: NUDIX domain-containing protein [Frankiales bacterium]|nr:NUDIX domain-containing protein [Frankiales bacterium]
MTAWPGFDVERSSVRVVLLDDDGRLLLFRTIDPTMPETGEWWELPGGGMEPGEDVVATAVREIAEETGFALDPAGVGAPTWVRDSTYVRRHRRTWQHEVVVTARVPGRAPVPRREGRTPEELEEYVGHRWWTAEEVREAGGGTRFFPARLPGLIGPFLAGERVDEPFDHWN